MTLFFLIRALPDSERVIWMRNRISRFVYIHGSKKCSVACMIREVISTSKLIACQLNVNIEELANHY
jgi:hypothetical protein